MPAPLEGIRVVDFSRVLAGPHCAQTLVDLGADVVKVEPPRPDISRFSPPSSGAMSGYYAQQNAGKRNISVDLWVREARDVALDLCRNADVVVENFRPGTLASFGLGYDDVAALNERVVYVSISGNGQDGPWQRRMAYAPTVQAEAGLTEVSRRHYGGALAEWRTDSLSHGDVYTGLQACIGVLAALEERHRSGRGQHIDVAMAATLVRINERAHVDAAAVDLGAEPAVLGATDSPFFTAPSGALIVSSTSLVSSLTFPFWLRAMRRPDLADHPDFGTAADRRRAFPALHAMVQQWMHTFATDDALDAQLDEAKIAIGTVRSLADLWDTEWAAHWGAFAETTDAVGGRHIIPGAPWRFGRSALPAVGPAAFRGEHNHSVLSELGRTSSDIERLERSGAVVSHVPTAET
jgi:crotonobetainyl-CoA:carnitine CoA-transferase CaiB-like acyl-CoA transferase